MGILRDAGWQPLSDTGAVMAAATATWSRTGTSTAKNTYSDKALTSANANPVVADASGRFGAIFGLEDEGYRLVLKNSAGTTIYTKDEQFSKATAAGESSARIAIVRSPMDYSAVGDGSTDDYTALAAAITALSTAGGGVLDLGGNTYRCDSALTVVANILIRNGAIDFSNASITYGIYGAAAQAGSSVISTATIGGQTVAVVSGTGFAVGQLVLLTSTDTLASGHKYAELHRVEGVSGNNILLDGTILGTYSTSPVLYRYTSVTNFRMEDVTITAPSAGYAIDLQFLEKVRLRNVTIIGTAAAESLRIGSCYDVVIDSCTVRQKTTTEACGIIVCDASRDVSISRCTIERALQAIEIGDDYGTYDGICRNTTVSDCHLIWCGQIEIAEGARFVSVDGNSMECDISPSAASTTAILIGGADVKVGNNTIRHAEGAAITITPLVGCDYINVVDNNINECEAIGISVTDTTFTVQSCKIDGNTIRGVDSKYIDVAGTAFFKLSVSRNDCLFGSGSAAAIDLTTADSILSLVVADNYIDLLSSYTTGIDVVGGTGSRRCSVSRNHMVCASAGTAIGIKAVATVFTLLDISGNEIGNDTAGGAGFGIGISSTGNTYTLMNGNLIELSSNAGATACISTDCGDVSIVGNVLRSSGSVGQGITAAAGTGLLISGNTIETDSDCIELVGSCNEVAITGNRCILTSATAGLYVLDLLCTGGSIAVTGNVLKRSGDDGINTIIGAVAGITLSG